MDNSNHHITPISAELKGHFLRLYQIALSDGEFSGEELKMLYEFAAERDVSKEQLDQILTEPQGIVDVPQSVSQKIEYLYDFSRMIWADGKVDPEEKAILLKYIRRFGFLDDNITSLAEYLLEAVKSGKSKFDILREIQ